MEITIKTSAENIEMANFLLGQAYKAAISSETFRKQFNVSLKELAKAEQFRKSLLNAYTKGRIPA